MLLDPTVSVEIVPDLVEVDQFSFAQLVCRYQSDLPVVSLVWTRAGLNDLPSQAQVIS